MKIFYVTTEDKNLQGDYLEVSVLNGLRTVFGDNVIDIPKKKVMYHDFSDSPRDQLHGRSFTLFQRPIADVSDRSIQPCKSDVIVYGVVPPTYGVKRRLDLEVLVGLTVVLDGHDDTRLRAEFVDDPNILYFKRELTLEPGQNIRPINFSIPAAAIRPVNFAQKKQLYPKTVPRGCFEDGYKEQGRDHYVFTDEKEYYDDLAASWFGVTKVKGGWDQLRHLEMVAAGCVVLWKGWWMKPEFCAPIDFPTRGFGDWQGAQNLMKLLMDGDNPTSFYLGWLNRQRAWLYQYGTCEAVATYVYREIVDYMRNKQ